MAGKNKKPDLLKIAEFMNGYLGKELLMGFDTPKHLHKEYDDMTSEERDELFEFAFSRIFTDSAMEVSDHIKRKLSLVELNLIRRRVLVFLKSLGMNYKIN
jgi:hypothetical protein